MTTANFHNELDLYFETSYEFCKAGKFHVEEQNDK